MNPSPLPLIQRNGSPTYTSGRTRQPPAAKLIIRDPVTRGILPVSTLCMPHPHSNLVSLSCGVHYTSEVAMLKRLLLLFFLWLAICAFFFVVYLFTLALDGKAFDWTVFLALLP